MNEDYQNTTDTEFKTELPPFPEDIEYIRDIVRLCDTEYYLSKICYYSCSGLFRFGRVEMHLRNIGIFLKYRVFKRNGR